MNDLMNAKSLSFLSCSPPLCPAMSVHDHVPYFFVVHRASSSAASFSVMCSTTRAHETTQESSSMEGKEKHHFEVIDW